MTRVSGGEPFLIESYFCCRKEDWVILVGYPLDRDFTLDELETLIDKIKKRFRPGQFSLIAPDIPPSFVGSCQERESDDYFTLDIPVTTIKSGIRRLINKAKENVKVERATKIRKAHQELTREFIERAKPPARVKNLLSKIADYVGHSKEVFVLNAWDAGNNLTAFYVVDLAAKDFTAYVVGCHSKANYAAGASDLLCLEMIKMSMEYGKNYIHLGLGVNRGIRQFKKKWGGTPTRRYEMCELVFRRPSILAALRAMGKIS
ncbi:MAG: hypothetical protein PVG99_00055 [Desulfobacteraceae bacterium]